MLGDIGDGLGLQGMQRPEQCRRQRQGSGCLAEAVAELRQQERAADDPEQGQAGQHVDRQIRQVIGQRIQAADGIVQREGEIHHGPGLQPLHSGVCWGCGRETRPLAATGGGLAGCRRCRYCHRRRKGTQAAR